MKPATFGPVYALGLYPPLSELFRAHGYALAIHGSLATDFDLIACPWTDTAGDPEAVMAEVLEKWAFDKDEFMHPSNSVSLKPHGRVAYRCHLSYASCYLDISFMPRLQKEVTDAPSP